MMRVEKPAYIETGFKVFLAYGYAGTGKNNKGNCQPTKPTCRVSTNGSVMHAGKNQGPFFDELLDTKGQTGSPPPCRNQSFGPSTHLKQHPHPTSSPTLRVHKDLCFSISMLPTKKPPNRLAHSFSAPLENSPPTKRLRGALKEAAGGRATLLRLCAGQVLFGRQRRPQLGCPKPKGSLEDLNTRCLPLNHHRTSGLPKQKGVRAAFLAAQVVSKSSTSPVSRHLHFLRPRFGPDVLYFEAH